MMFFCNFRVSFFVLIPFRASCQNPNFLQQRICKLENWSEWVPIRISVLYTIHEKIPIHEFLTKIRVLDTYTT